MAEVALDTPKRITTSASAALNFVIQPAAAAAPCEPDAYGTFTAKLTPAVLKPASASLPKSSS